MKKVLLTVIITLFAFAGYSQTIGVNFTKQSIVVVPAVTVNADTATITSVMYGSNGVFCNYTIGGITKDMQLWTLQDSIVDTKWGDEDVIKQFKANLKIK